MSIHEDVMRHLDGRGVKWEGLTHAQSESAIQEAIVVGVDPDHVAKTLLLHLSHGLALAVVPGGRRVDKHKLHRAAADPHARLATEEEMSQAFPGYPLGTLPPLPGLLGITAYLDPRVKEQGMIVFAAGSHTGSVRMAVSDLLALERFAEADLTIAGKDGG